MLKNPNPLAQKLTTSTMETPNPLLSFSAFVHQHSLKLGTELASRLDETRKAAAKLASTFPSPPPSTTSPTRTQARPSPWPWNLNSSSLPFASVSQQQEKQKRQSGKQVSDDPNVTANKGLSSDQVAKTLAGTSVYTVSNTNNEFVLISDPDGSKSIGLLCFRHEDAQAFLAQVRARKGEVRGGAKVVPITLDQVYMLKVEGIAFRFLPDPVQIKNALELKTSNLKSGFDGVPVFQSDLLVVKKKNRRFCPIYFRKEDIEKELSTVSRASRGAGVSQHIVVGSLEDVLKKMEVNQKNSGWDDLIFIPPGKSHSQHINEIARK